MFLYTLNGLPITSEKELTPDELAALNAKYVQLLADYRRTALETTTKTTALRIARARELRKDGKIITPKRTEKAPSRGKN